MLIQLNITFKSKFDKIVIEKKLNKLLNTKLIYSTNDKFYVLTKEDENFRIVTPFLTVNQLNKTYIRLSDFLTNNVYFDDNNLLGIVLLNNNKLINLTKINKLKYVTEFDEQFIFRKLPAERTNKFITSLKNIYKNVNVDVNSFDKINTTHFSLRISDYSPIQLNDLISNKINVNYISGYNIIKTTQVLEIIDYIVKFTSKQLTNNILTDESKKKLFRLYKIETNFRCNFKHIDTFNAKFDKVKIFYDMKPIKTNNLFILINDKLADFLFKTKVTSATINYDSSINKLEIKGATIKNAKDLSNVNLVSCKVDKTLLYNVRSKNTTYTNCVIKTVHTHNDTINDSICDIIYTDRVTKIKNSILKGDQSLYNCKIDNCRLINGTILNDAKITK